MRKKNTIALLLSSNLLLIASFSLISNDDKKFMLHELRLWDEATKMREFLQSKSILVCRILREFQFILMACNKKIPFFPPFHPRVFMNFSCPLVNKKVIYFNRSRLWNKLLGLFIESKHHVTICVCFNSYMWTKKISKNELTCFIWPFGIFP